MNASFRLNRMKSLLRAGTAVAGTMLVEFRQPAVMQVLKNAGYDFATIDMEHGVFDYESVADLSRFGRHIGITPLVRVPDKQYPYIARALDVGAQGIMVPRLRSAEEVRDVVNIIKYPPMGGRGCSFGRGHTDFHGGPLTENMRAAQRGNLAHSPSRNAWRDRGDRGNRFDSRCGCAADWSD